MHLFQLRDCSKEYKQGTATVVAVAPATVSFHSGITMITGKSGSGKSTLLNLLAGFEPPTTGEILFQETNISINAKQITALKQKQFGFIFQSYELIPEFCVRDNILLPTYINRTNAKDRLDSIVTVLGIEALLTKSPAVLSGGEQQRVAIARAIIHQPNVIFADEPTGNLDQANSQIVMNLLSTLCKQEGTSLIMVTHDQDLISYADHHYQMDDGRVIPQ